VYLPTNHSMPGLAMDPGQISASPTPHNYRSNATNDSRASQPFIKDENANENENTIGVDEYDEHTYKPRPQLPRPFVVMRSLAHLISRHK
jgi:hypothetical protein